MAKLRLISSQEALDQGDLSLLAILETAGAMILAIWIAAEEETFRWLAMTAAVAPFLLLRTPQSEDMGLKWFDHYESFLNITNPLHGVRSATSNVKLVKIHNLRGFISWLYAEMRFQISQLTFDYRILYVIIILFFYQLLSIPVALIIKFVVTVYFLVRHPIYTLSCVPRNWQRIALQTDIFQAPEYVPGYEAYKSTSQATRITLKFSIVLQICYEPILYLFQIVKDTQHDPVWLRLFRITKAVSILAGGLGYSVYNIILFYIPTTIYRYSLKSSSIIYAPLIYVAGGFSKITNVNEELDQIRNGITGKATLCYAVFALVTFGLVPLIFHSFVIEVFSHIEADIPAEKREMFRSIVGHWIFVYAWIEVHISRFISAIHTIVLVILADREIRKRQYGVEVNDDKLRKRIRGIKIVRSITGSYTAIKGAIILAPLIHIPPVIIFGEEVFLGFGGH